MNVNVRIKPSNDLLAELLNDNRTKWYYFNAFNNANKGDLINISYKRGKLYYYLTSRPSRAYQSLVDVLGIERWQAFNNHYQVFLK